jgi:hypothetical protein
MKDAKEDEEETLLQLTANLVNKVHKLVKFANFLKQE